MVDEWGRFTVDKIRLVWRICDSGWWLQVSPTMTQWLVKCTVHSTVSQSCTGKMTVEISGGDNTYRDFINLNTIYDLNFRQQSKVDE